MFEVADVHGVKNVFESIPEAVKRRFRGRVPPIEEFVLRKVKLLTPDVNRCLMENKPPTDEDGYNDADRPHLPPPILELAYFWNAHGQMEHDKLRDLLVQLTLL